MAAPWMRKRGWTSNDVLHRAKLELIERGLITQTRQGGLNAGANLYAVTWLPITNFAGLDIRSKDYHPGTWRFMDTIPVIGVHKLSTTSPCSENNKVSSALRCGSAPFNGVVDQFAAPPHGVKVALS